MSKVLYFYVHTYADGWHTSEPVEISYEEFHAMFAEFIQKYKLTPMSRFGLTTWLHFSTTDEDADGIALFTQVIPDAS